MKKLVSKILRDFRPTSYSDYFNTPAKVFNGEPHFNERIVEKPFIHRTIETLVREKNITQIHALELGHTRSDLALELSSSGVNVVGVDLRPYGFSHKNFKEHCLDLEEFKTDTRFHFIYSVSVLEHVGLGTYGEPSDPEKLIRIFLKLHKLLREDGVLAFTVPCGISHEDDFLRSFAPEELDCALQAGGFVTAHEEFYKRGDDSLFFPVDKDHILNVSNKPTDRGPTGVNGVGCFRAKKVPG